MNEHRRPFCSFLACALLPLLAGGCGPIGLLAHAMPQKQKPAYTGLAGHSLGVMVWADRGTRMDWDSIQVDVASAVQDKLQKSNAPEVKGSRYPIPARQIRRYQLDYPETELLPATEVAPKFAGLDRLIYIEITSFATRSEASMQLFRGNAAMTLKVIEVVDSKGKIAFQEDNIRATFPPKAPTEGVINTTDVQMYRGEIGAMADAIVKRLTTYELDDE